jgi:hypothetical protein
MKIILLSERRTMASQDKKPKKSRSRKKEPSIEFSAIPKLTLNMPLDEKKIVAIQRCIANGELKLTISKVDLKAGKIAEAWLYD